MSGMTVEVGGETTITAGVDVGHLFKAMRDAFTDKSKVVMELMQNARRAGSPTVEIEYDAVARILTVKDDGIGIENFGSLLQLAKTGWDSKTASTESAFGIGFWAAVYGCERLQVESKGRGFVADTADILAFKDVTLYACDESRTIVRMIGLHKPIGEAEFSAAARGFPIPVLFNGVELQRDRALDDSFAKTQIGHVRLSRGTSTSALLYLQGFKIGEIDRFYSSGEDVTVVHLDPTVFRARAPDRDCLVDADEAKKTVAKVIASLWVKKFKACKAEGKLDELMGAAKFLIGLGAAKLFNDVPVIPACVLDRVSVGCFGDSNSSARFEGQPKDMSREQAESATLVLDGAVEATYSSLESLRYDGLDESRELMEEFNRIQYLELRDAISVDDKLDAGHWVYKLPNLIKEPIKAVTVEAVEASEPVSISGRCIDHSFVPCVQIRMSGPLGEVVSDDAVGLVEVSGHVAIAVPVGASTLDLAEMLSDYQDEHDVYMQDWYDDDCSALSTELAVARYGDVSLLIKRAVDSLLYSSAGQKLKGRTFTVTFGSGRYGDLSVKEKASRIKKASPARA